MLQLNGLDKAKFATSKHANLLVWKGNDVSNLHLFPQLHCLDILSDTFTFYYSQWGDGLPSVHRKDLPKSSAGISSFEALDAILCHFADARRYPSLRRIVLCKFSPSPQSFLTSMPKLTREQRLVFVLVRGAAGHSMGGQLVHRYSILGSVPIRPEVEVKYVVMNPASFLYFAAERAGPAALVSFCYLKSTLRTGCIC